MTLDDVMFMVAKLLLAIIIVCALALYYDRSEGDEKED